MNSIVALLAAGRRLPAVAALALLLAACAPTRVETNYSAVSGAMARPQIIVVQDFAIPGGGATLDQGLRARLERTFESGERAAAESTSKALEAADALAASIVEQLSAVGLPATRSASATQPAGGTMLIVAGQLVSLDEGNRTRRNLIGFGAGHSDVTAEVQLYLVQDGGAPRLIESFAADAQSSRKPGVAATGGVGAATGRIAESAAVGIGSSALSNGSAEGDAERMGKEIAKKIAAHFPAPR